jgi:hypothetical protein
MAARSVLKGEPMHFTHRLARETRLAAFLALFQGHQAVRMPNIHYPWR